MFAVEAEANRITAARYPALVATLGLSAAVGLLILLAGLLLQGSLRLAWFIPTADFGAVICLLPTAVLAGIDANLRRDSRSLPVVGIAVGVSVLWLVHFATFPGNLPGKLPGASSEVASEITSWIFLLINLTMPFAVALALIQRPRPLRRPALDMIATAALGLGGALTITMMAVVLAVGPLRTLQPGGAFTWITYAVGVAGLLPALIAFALFGAGRQGDVRIAAGVLSALVFCALESISLLFLQPRFTPPWYAVHVLAFLPNIALLAGQLQIYVVSVRSEQAARAEADRVAGQLRSGFELAVEMATQIDMAPLIERLLEGARNLVDAERASLVRIEDGMAAVETGLDSGGRPAPAGVRNAIGTLTSEGRPILAEAVEEKRTVIAGPYAIDGLPETYAKSLRGLKHTMVVPLILRGEVIAALVLSRRHDAPFTTEESDRLRELSVISALLLRNARLLDSAQEASTAKSRFLNMAAHELRTPLSVITGYVDMLLSETFGELDARMAPPLRVLADKSLELARQVEKLLVASRLDAAAGTSMLQEIDLAEAAAQAIQRVEPRADLMRARIGMHLPDVPVPVIADPDDIALVLDNLLNNALTYSEPPPRVSLSLKVDEEVELRVADSGIGIPPEQRERIFEQFHRVENPDFGYPPGTGLGLFISRRLAERNGGSLVVEESEPGRGSVFLLTLVRAQARQSSST